MCLCRCATATRKPARFNGLLPQMFDLGDVGVALVFVTVCAEQKGAVSIAVSPLLGITPRVKMYL